MKALVIAIVLLAATAAAENPDSRPSIQFGFNGIFGAGHVESFGYSLQKYDATDLGFSGSLTWPVSENATLLLGGGYATGSTDWKQTLNFLPQEVKGHGLQVSAGVRLYIGPSINK